MVALGAIVVAPLAGAAAIVAFFLGGSIGIVSFVALVVLIGATGVDVVFCIFNTVGAMVGNDDCSCIDWLAALVGSCVGCRTGKAALLGAALVLLLRTTGTLLIGA